ncbi:MAG: HNH endonuclease [Planctomycetaceae bacterium]|nr:HNH endonuclease [Planctomycetaceae bacterium]
MSDTSDSPLEATLIEGHPGYAVDQMGNVWSCWRGNSHKAVGWHKLKPQSGVAKLHHVYLGGGEKVRRVYIATLMLETFIGPRPPGHVVVFKNRDKSDHRLENLAWATRSEARHTHRNSPKLTIGNVEDIIRRLVAGETHSSIARRFGVTRHAVTMIAAGATWKHVPRPENMPRRRFVAESGPALTPYLERLVRFRIKRGDDRKTIASDFGVSMLEVGRIERKQPSGAAS